MIGVYGTTAGLGWFGMLIMVLFWLGVIALVVWLVGVPRSITVIKSVHTVVFFLLSALLVILVYEVLTGKMTFLTWIAVSLFLAEGVVLMTNGWRCPLTTLAESLGSTHGQITDTFLPKWFADRVFRVYGGLFAGALLVLIIRLLS
jgi:hypothetical protein